MTNIELSNIEKVLGFAEFDEAGVDMLERAIEDCNAAATKGSPLVADSLYDRLIELLTSERPQSALLSHLWNDDETGNTDYTEHLQANPMMSIQTVKRWDDKEVIRWMEEIEDGMSIHMSFKIDGHAVRVVYDKGELVSATSRARSSQGRDLTRQMRNILGDRNEMLSEQGIVEVRGEVCLHIGNLEEARKFNPDIKSAFSAVASLIKPSSVPEENQLMDFLAYRVIGSDSVFDFKSDEYSYLEELGFTVPDNVTFESEGDIISEVQEVIESLSEQYDEYGYYCDGIVAEIDDRDVFDSLGSEGIRANGNIALKVERWGQDLYQGIVQYIEWTKGKVKLSPVAIIADVAGKAVLDEEGKCWNFNELGVLTAHGGTVRRVPLYKAKNILTLEAATGRPINFRYGGESGVVPCDARGNLLTDDALEDALTA